MANVSGIAIVIKAFLPTGKTLDEQFAALSIVKDAHASGDYAALLAAAQIDEVKTEQKVRRMEDAPQTSPLPDDETEFAEVGEDTPEHAGNFADGLDEPRVNPEDGDPLDQPVAEEEPTTRQRRMAR